MYYCCGITEKGIRPHNEDAMLLKFHVRTEGALQIASDAPMIAAVADGVSGEKAGELASQLCLKLLAAVKYRKKVSLKRTLLDIHKQIAETSQKQADTENMQTTLCGFAIDEQHGLHCFNVGDSRLYRFRGGALEQISRDQTLVQMLYDEGTITSEEKKNHTHRNIVLPVMGNLGDPPKPEIIPFSEGMQTGDVLLICSDGLTDYVTDHEIAESLAAAKPLPLRLEALVQTALKKGGKDNITVIAAVRYPEGIPLPPCEWT